MTHSIELTGRLLVECCDVIHAGSFSSERIEPVEVEKLSDNESPQLIINTFKSLPPFLNNYDYFKNAI